MTNLQKELLEAYEYQKKLLLSYKALVNETNVLEKEYQNVLKRYNSLSNSKLGRLQRAYWSRRKK